MRYIVSKGTRRSQYPHVALWFKKSFIEKAVYFHADTSYALQRARLFGIGYPFGDKAYFTWTYNRTQDKIRISACVDSGRIRSSRTLVNLPIGTWANLKLKITRKWYTFDVMYGVHFYTLSIPRSRTQSIGYPINFKFDQRVKHDITVSIINK